MSPSALCKVARAFRRRDGAWVGDLVTSQEKMTDGFWPQVCTDRPEVVSQILICF